MNTKRFFKTAFLTLSVLNSTVFFKAAFAGGESGGGGDASEARVNEIRSDILSWINKGGAAGLKLSIPLSFYEVEMKKVLQNKAVEISFTESKVEVSGKEKTCRGLIEEKKPQIICNIPRFQNTKDADQYRLVHHEYAGLAGVEKNEDAASDYEISNQLTDFLKEEKVLKLALASQKNKNAYVLGDFVGKYKIKEGPSDCRAVLSISQDTDNSLIILLDPHYKTSQGIVIGKDKSEYNPYGPVNHMGEDYKYESVGSLNGNTINYFARSTWARPMIIMWKTRMSEETYSLTLSENTLIFYKEITNYTKIINKKISHSKITCKYEKVVLFE